MMKSIRLLDRRLGYSFSAVALLLGMVVPSLVPAFASAAQVTTRSMTLSSATADASGVSYKLQFTPITPEASGAVVVWFCNDSPLVGQTCTAPTGFTAASSAVGSGSDTMTITNKAANYVEFTTNLTAAAHTYVFSGIHNPTSPTTGVGANGLYARIQTYASSTDADAAITDATAPGSVVDTGGIALAITQQIGVTAYVRESMTFCVAGSGDDGSVPAPDAGCSGTIQTPSMTLGETVGSQKALDATHLSTGVDYAQLSTNASGGAVVNLKSSATACGGLVRIGGVTGNCDIKPQDSTTAGATITAGQALFGLLVGSAATAPTATSPSGTLQVAAGANYSSSDYFLDYQSGDTAGVTSPYGSPLIDSAGAPVSNKYIPITFGASIDNTTPAGQYAATFDMIAVGTF